MKEKVIAKKKYGQNFLSDKNILERISQSANLDKDTLVIEIGPGTGNLTEYFLKYANKVIAFEIDKDLIPLLNDRFKNDNLILINEDILNVDIAYYIDKYKTTETKIVIAGNLPYYITTPIILGLLEKKLNVNNYLFMVQEEVADRFSATPSKKEYNSLSVLINYKTNCRKLFRVTRNYFNPIPNVDSAIIELIPKEIKNKPDNEDLFFTLNRAIFKQRRKTLLNNLKEFNLPKEDMIKIILKLGFKETVRPEELSTLDIINLSNEVNKL